MGDPEPPAPVIAEPAPPPPAPRRVFYSYAHEDRRLLDHIKRHLSLLRREGLIVDWYDGMLRAGEPWAVEIAQRLAESDIILLLVSAYFIESDFCFQAEMTTALERHRNGLATVVPVILKPCDWKTAPFAELQALPTDARPITEWSNREAAYLTVANGIRRIVQ
jgi:hypothetical protein